MTPDDFYVPNDLVLNHLAARPTCPTPVLPVPPWDATNLNPLKRRESRVKAGLNGFIHTGREARNSSYPQVTLNFFAKYTAS